MAQEEEKEIKNEKMEQKEEKKIEIFKVDKKEFSMIRIIDLDIWEKLTLGEKLSLNSFEIVKNNLIKPAIIDNKFENNCKKIDILNENVCDYLINIQIQQLGPDCFAFAPCQMIIIAALSANILQPLLNKHNLIMNSDVMNYIILSIANQSVVQQLWNNSIQATHILNSHGGTKEVFMVQVVQYLFGIKDYIPVGLKALWPPESGEIILNECGLGVASMIIPKPISQNFYPTGSVLDMDRETFQQLLSKPREVYVVVLSNINEYLWKLLQSNNKYYEKEDKKNYLFIKNSWINGQYWTVKKESFMWEILLASIVSIPVTPLLLFHSEHVINKLDQILGNYEISPKEEEDIIAQERRGGDWGSYFLTKDWTKI